VERERGGCAGFDGRCWPSPARASWARPGLAGRPAEPDVAEHLLTAVNGSWRRRGVAMALKSAQIDWARGAGYRELVAFNNGANEPMRRLNALLGYAPRPAWITFHGPLAP